MSRPAKVTLTLREEDARWLSVLLNDSRRILIGDLNTAVRIRDELKHALGECACGKEKK